MSTDIFAIQYQGTPVQFSFPNPDDHVARQIMTGRQFYETTMLEHIRARLNDGCVILDIGAHIGNHSVFFGKFCQPAQVHAFEPYLESFNGLRRNIAINGLADKVTTHNLALGAADTTASIVVTDANNSGMSRVVPDEHGTALVRSLDGLLLPGLERCDCIKLDVEGMEMAVLEGAAALIERFHPLIYVECAYEAGYQDVRDRLAAFGYQSIRAFNATPTYCFVHTGSENRDHADALPYRIAFFAGDEGNFQFARDIIRYFKNLGAEVHVVESAVPDVEELRTEMKWCDLAWFEWGNGPIVQASQMPKCCRIVCRVHKYEIYTGSAKSVDWRKVDDLILVSPRFIDEFKCRVNPDIEEKTRVHFIPNALDMEKFTVTDVDQKKAGFDIAFVARFHADKNPALMLYVMHALVKRDDRYRCHVAGRIQDPVQFQYFEHMVKTLGLAEHVIYHGHIDDIHAWLSDKHYLLSTSVLESQGVGIMEAMALGLKPVIHNHAGDPACHFERKYIFNSIDEAVAMIVAEKYEPQRYRDHVENNYALNRVQPRYRQLVEDCVGPKKNGRSWQPRISIVVPTYNRAELLREAVLSALDQDYPNFELLVINDGSTDHTPQILAELTDPRLRVIDKAHSGSAESRNRAIAEAEGEFLLCLGSDDLLMPNVLADYVAVLNRFPEADVVYPDLEIFDASEHTRQIQYPEYYFDKDLIGKIINGNLIPDGGSLVRRDLYTEVGVYDATFKRAHDYEFWSRALDGARLKHLYRTTYRWRWHGGNMSAENQKVDRSYEARIVCGLIKRYSLERLFPELNWSHTDATTASAYLRIATMLLHWDAHVEAGEYVNKAQQVDPTNPEIPFLRNRLQATSYNIDGETAYEHGEIDKALTHFNDAIQCDNSFVDGYINLGAAFWKQHDHASSLKCLAAALKLAPYNTAAIINTAMVLAEIGQTGEARSLCEGYLERDPFLVGVQDVAQAVN